MAFTRPIVDPVDIAMRAVTRATRVVAPDRDELGPRPGPASWVYVVTMVGLLMVLAWVTVERSVAADRAHRAEVQAREGHFYRQLLDRDAILESQRRIYLERIRRLEAALWRKDQEMSALRTRAVPSTRD